MFIQLARRLGVTIAVVVAAFLGMSAQAQAAPQKTPAGVEFRVCHR
jgi:hypothetical protein